MTYLSVTDELLLAARTPRQLTVALTAATPGQRSAFDAAMAARTPDVEPDELCEVVRAASSTIPHVAAMLARTGRGSRKATQVDDVLIRKLWDATGGDAVAPTRANVLGRICGLQAVAAFRSNNLRDEGIGLDGVKSELVAILGRLHQGSPDQGVSLKSSIELDVDPLVLQLSAAHAGSLENVALQPYGLDIAA